VNIIPSIANVQSVAFDFRAAANPFKVLVGPRFLVFDILALVSLHYQFFLRFMLHTALEMAFLISSARAASSSEVVAPSSRE
jgi:hypothetical protein